MSVKMNELIDQLELLVSHMGDAKLEAIKEESYSCGYMDALKDVLSGSVEFDRVLAMKFDGEIKTENYEEITKGIETVISNGKTMVTEAKSRHPSMLASSTMDRLKKSRANLKTEV